ncbi:MAG: four helix bundle protein [Parcubacteria group bacterium]
MASIKNREEKGIYLNRASNQFDVLKFLLLIIWEIKKLDTKKYIALSNHTYEIGKMLGGWIRQTKTPKGF